MAITALPSIEAVPVPGHAYSTLTQTQLDISYTLNAFEKGKNACAAHDYDQAIEFYTEALHSLQTDLTAIILHHRAFTYELKQNYKQALHDSQQANPNNDSIFPDPYLIGANVLILTNKPQEAVTLCEKGRNHVLSENHRELLVKKSEQAKEAVSKQNQWMTNFLPFEVSSRILSLIPFMTRIQLSRTCKFWNKYLLQDWPDMWSTIADNDLPNKKLALDRFLQQIPANRVKKVILSFSSVDDRDYLGFMTIQNSNGDSEQDDDDYFIQDVPDESDDEEDDSEEEDGDDEMLCDDEEEEEEEEERPRDYRIAYPSNIALKTILEKNWCKIESIEIKNVNKAKLHAICEINKSTLRDVQLYDNTSGYTMRYPQALYDVLTLCPNLRSVCTIFYNDSYSSRFGYGIIGNNQQAVLPLPPLPENLQLTHLALSIPMALNELQHLIKHVPRLISLALDVEHFISYGETLQIIYDFCPELRSLTYTRIGPGYKSSSLSSSTPTPSSAGLRMLKLYIPEYKAKGDANIDFQVARFLERSSNTIEYLELKTEPLSKPGKHQWLTVLQKHTAPKLHTLKLYGTPECPQFGSRHLSMLLDACPSLHDVSLAGRYFFNDSVLHHLGRCGAKHLNIYFQDDKLCFSEPEVKPFDGDGIVTIRGIAGIFEESETLQVFNFMGDCLSRSRDKKGVLAKNLGKQISKCKTIRQVNFSSFQLFGDKELVPFLEELKDSDLKILKVKLVIFSRMSEKLIKAFAALRNMEYIQLKDENCYVDQEALIKIFDAHRQGNCQRFAINVAQEDCNYVKGCKEYPCRMDHEPEKRYSINVNRFA